MFKHQGQALHIHHGKIECIKQQSKSDNTNKKSHKLIFHLRPQITETIQKTEPWQPAPKRKAVDRPTGSHLRWNSRSRSSPHASPKKQSKIK
jgi:hypothetical protein